MPTWEVLAGNRVLVDLPVGELDDLVAAGEVMLTQRLSAWVLGPGRQREFARLREIFGRRVRLGVAGLRTPGQIVSSVSDGADFLLTVTADDDLVSAAGDTPIALGALTPTELARAARLGGAVQVVPADAMGTMYSRTLPAMFADVPLIATGRMERFIAELWLQAGAAAVCPMGWIEPELIADPDLTDLRRRLLGLDFNDLDG